MPQARQQKQSEKVEKTPRRNARPRIDALIKHIKGGSYDNDMATIQAAIDERRKIRQQAVYNLVTEVFGEDYEIQLRTTSRPRPGKKPNGDVSISPDVDPELAEAEARARMEEERLRAETSELADDDPENSPDIESRSPIIGSVGQ